MVVIVVIISSGFPVAAVMMVMFDVTVRVFDWYTVRSLTTMDNGTLASTSISRISFRFII